MVKARNMALFNASGRPLVRKSLVKQSQSHGSGSQDTENKVMGAHTIYEEAVSGLIVCVCMEGEDFL